MGARARLDSHRSKRGHGAAPSAFARAATAPASLAAIACIACIACIGCDKHTHWTLRTVTMHAPQACAADGSAYAEVFALGDFDPAPPAKGHYLHDVGEVLPELDAQARALVVDASENGLEWLGQASVPPAGDVDVLLWPFLVSCGLSAPVDTRAGATLAPLAGGRVLVVGGSGNPTPRTLVADLTTGRIEPIDVGLLTQRTRASVTAFGEGALVAGGVATDGTVLATAEAYEPGLRGFDQQRPIQLGDSRADQGAVVMASGETLLVGGVGADGKTPLASMMVVDPLSRIIRTERIAQLAVPRRAATVLRLASGEILVAGGFDAGGNAIPTLEWFSADASQTTRRPRDLVTGAARAFAALDAGGALAVIAPPPNAQPVFQNVWVIDADGAFEPAAPVMGTLTRPILFGRAAGAPVLWTGDRWLRWQPWAGAFAALDAVAAPVPVGDATCSADPGLAMWIAEGAPTLTGLRFDVRGTYSKIGFPLLVGDAADMAPDRLPAPGVVAFDPSVGLTLGPGATAFVTDRTYQGVAIDVEAPTGEPAIVVLRDEQGNELEVGGPSCAAALSGPTRAMHVDRAAAVVTWSAGSAHAACAGRVRPDARIAVGLRGPAQGARAVARNLRVARTGQP